ncbi:MAG: hypothetical protein ACOC0Z_03325 [Halohasta sp.]
MVFAEILDRVEDRRRRLVFYNAEDRQAAVDRIVEYVGVHDVDIEYVTDEGLPESTVVVRDGQRTLSADDIESVYEYLVAWESELKPSGEVPSLFSALDETVFRSRNKDQLLLASRLIENRAASLGAGHLSAGFQQLSLARPQLPFYRALPSAVDISLYGEADWLPPADTEIEAYEPTCEDHADYWWVIYDGTDTPNRHAALLAEEQAPGEYTGFWTYRTPIVEAFRAIVDDLEVRRVTDSN